MTGSRILLADDHSLVADAVAAVLKATGDYSVDTVADFDEAIKSLGSDNPYDIVMLDLRMPGFTGLGSVRSIVDVAGSAQVVLFSANVDQKLLPRAVEIGVRGFIPKTMPIKSLPSVLSLVASGQMFFPSNLLKEQAIYEEKAQLSETELYTLKAAASGLTNKHIANELDITEAMVKMHMRSVCKKLGARNRAHAAMIGRDLSLIDV